VALALKTKTLESFEIGFGGKTIHPSCSLGGDSCSLGGDHSDFFSVLQCGRNFYHFGS
jgi:hypothetical protein